MAGLSKVKSDNPSGEMGFSSVWFWRRVLGGKIVNVDWNCLLISSFCQPPKANKHRGEAWDEKYRGFPRGWNIVCGRVYETAAGLITALRFWLIYKGGRGRRSFEVPVIHRSQYARACFGGDVSLLDCPGIAKIMGWSRSDSRGRAQSIGLFMLNQNESGAKRNNCSKDSSARPDFVKLV